MSKIFKVGFCGAGGIVRGNHLPSLESRGDRYQVIGFYDVVAENARKLAEDKYQAYTAYEEMLADDNIDLVVIATKPLTTHYPTAKQALEANKHVVLEKPMASTAGECNELIALARSRNLVFTIHHNRRLDLDFLALQDIIRQGKIGDPVLIVNRVGGGGYGGGDFVDWGVHLVDQSLLLNASPLKEVSAVFCNPAGGVADSGFVEAVLRFEKYPLVRLSMIPRTTEYLLNGTDAATRFYAAGTRGAFTQRTIECPNDMMNATQNFDKAKPEYAVPDYLEIKQKEYYDYLYESLANGAPLLVQPEEARNAIRCIELIEQSAKENRTVPTSNN